MSLFEAIAYELKSRIRKGVYRPGEKIPSIRELALDFGCNKITVQKAFDILKSEGILENTVGSGSYIRYPEYMPESVSAYDFKNAYISHELFPYRTFADIFSGMMERDGAAAFSQPPVKGMPSLIDTVSSFYNIPADRMIIVSGAQQGLDITKKALGPHKSSRVIFEDPSYPGAASLFRPSDFIRMGKDGPDTGRLRSLGESGECGAFYSMPAVHNPTGFSYSEQSLGRTAEIIADNGLYVIEDDHDSEFVPSPRPRFIDIIPERTIYVKSLSKTLASGIRLGLIICPADLFEAALMAKYKTDIATSGLAQRLVDNFIKSGDYASFIASTASEMAARRKKLVSLLKKHPGLSVEEGTSGHNLWVNSGAPLFGSAPPWTPGDRFSYSPDFDSYFRLSFMNIAPADFEKALDFLDSYLHAALSSATS